VEKKGRTSHHQAEEGFTPFGSKGEGTSGGPVIASLIILRAESEGGRARGDTQKSLEEASSRRGGMRSHNSGATDGEARRGNPDLRERGAAQVESI